ncbi:hypothetical protein LP419_35550 [Massilia sp. H-1]|nr:hypothetical protein LP419_35550 [Massilia sp. H-1]
MQAAVDIYPEQRAVHVNASYTLLNKTALPQDTLRLQVNPDYDTRWLSLPAHKVVLDDKVVSFSILKLAQPLAPGASLNLAFTVDVKNPGFINNGMA